MLRTSLTKGARLTGTRFVQTKALSKATLTDLPERWENMPNLEQKEIADNLTERQKLPWKTLNNEEIKAAWYISYGEWGLRRPVHGKGDVAFITKGVFLGLGISFGLFSLVRLLANPETPKTMNREWQLKSDEYLKSKNANPWGGYSQVQSK